MNRTSRPLLVAATVGTLLLGAGCANTTPQAPPAASAAATTAPPATTPETVAWANKVCTTLQSFTKVVSTQPKLDTTSLPASVKSLSDYIGQVTASLDSAIADLQKVGPSPAPGGDEVVKKVSDALGQYRVIFAKMKTNLDQTKPTDGAALQTALAPLADIKNVPNPSAGLQASPQLEVAISQAPNCQGFAITAPTTAPGG